MKWNPKIFPGGTAFSLFIILMIFPTALAAGENLSDREQLGLELQVELKRLGSSGDPTEREALLHRIAGECQGTEAAEAAYWSLSDLYLDSFANPEVTKAREVLELFLKQYPDSRWAGQAKYRLLALYDGKDARATQLRRELLADSGLPQGVKGYLKDGAGAPPRLVLPAAPRKNTNLKSAGSKGSAPKKTVQKTRPNKKGSGAKKATPVKKSTKGTSKKRTVRKKR
ncbi:MAG: hypothetical protein K5841_08630 [Fretibacterium sp.]|nr:hypothetical protein [Fretibacterium sp.]